MADKRRKISEDDEDTTTTFLAFLGTVVDVVSHHDDTDIICECDCNYLDELLDHAEDLFDLANQKLHVFPFKEVRPCWFRLFTDTSIIKAVQVVQKAVGAQSNISSVTIKWLDEVVWTLDMALIMAGALGREEVIANIFAGLEKYVCASDGQHRDKRSRQLTSSATTLLPTRKVSIPVLNHSIETLDSPSLDDFSKWMHQKRKPVKLNNILSAWPALDQWPKTSHWLGKTFQGRRLVPIETGRSYIDDGWGQKIVPFGKFLDTYILEDASNASERGYLAQHDLFKQLPSLYADITVPDFCYLDAPGPEPGTPLAMKAANEASKAAEATLSDTSEEDAQDSHEVQRNIWFGAAWTITPLHHDPYHNVLCQVVGTKYIRLYSPHHSSKLQPMSKTEAAPHVSNEPAGTSSATIDMSNTSQIDVAAMEISPHEDWDAVYPGLSEVPYLECLLEAGEALYIPVGWWHYVRSCSVGISVSFWW